MTEFELISVCWWKDGADHEEIDGIDFPELLVRPVIGDEIHYWQDGTPEQAGREPLNRRDFVVTKVQHDLRFMPARGNPLHVHVLNIWLKETT